jgi:hypothetical protein
VNWRNCGCKWEGLYWYNWRTGAPLVWNYKCRIGVEGTHSQEVLQVPSIETTSVFQSNRITWVALVPQLQLCRLHLLLSVRSVSDIHSLVPQLFAVPVSRRRCCSCSNALVPGCFHVPVTLSVPVPVPVPVPHCYRYPRLAPYHNVCISPSFRHNVALLCTAVCSTHNVTSSTARSRFTGGALVGWGEGPWKIFMWANSVLFQYSCGASTL